MKSYEDLKAWQAAMDLVEEIYHLSADFPTDERYGLTAQIRKAANSVVANIAEGFGRYTYPDKANKYTIARGECTEVEAFLKIAIRLGFTSVEKSKKAFEKTDVTGRILSGLIQSCKTRKNSPSTRVF